MEEYTVYIAVTNKSFTVEYCRFDVSHACNAQKYLLWRFCCNQCRASIISMRDAAHVNSRNEICVSDGDPKTREEEGKESRNYSNLSADGKPPVRELDQRAGRAFLTEAGQPANKPTKPSFDKLHLVWENSQLTSFFFFLFGEWEAIKVIDYI